MQTLAGPHRPGFPQVAGLPCVHGSSTPVHLPHCPVSEAGAGWRPPKATSRPPSSLFTLLFLLLVTSHAIAHSRHIRRNQHLGMGTDLGCPQTDPRLLAHAGTWLSLGTRRRLVVCETSPGPRAQLRGLQREFTPPLPAISPRGQRCPRSTLPHGSGPPHPLGSLGAGKQAWLGRGP